MHNGCPVRIGFAMWLLPLFLSAAPLKSPAYFPDEAAKDRDHRPDLGATVDDSPGQGNEPADTGPEGAGAPKFPVSEADLRTIEILALVGAPANDNFANATIVTGKPGDSPPPSFFGDNINATKEPGEPNHAGNPGGRSVWWKWTAPAHALVSLYSSQSDFDTVLAVYTGQAVNALTVVAHQRFTVPLPEAYFFDATAGTTYYFAVDGLNGASGNISMSLGMMAATPPVITSHPQDVTIMEGADTLLRVEAGGTGPFDYQWYFNGSAIDHGVSFNQPIYRAKPSDAGNYHVVVSTAFGTATSATARVTVTLNPWPVITQQPVGYTLTVGDGIAFNVTVTSHTPLTYQWFYNGAPLAGATGSSLIISSVSVTHTGTYSVNVSNSHGTTSSSVATLTVKPAVLVLPSGSSSSGGGGAPTWWSLGALGLLVALRKYRQDWK